MPTLTISKTYADATALTEADLDNIVTATEAFLSTGIDSDNIQSEGIAWVNLKAEVTSRFHPVGTILPWYSYSGTLSFSSTYYAYCDGSAATLTTAGDVTLPDLSDRYLVGIGTEGNGDIGTATWAATAVGNTSHVATFTHTHTGPSHTHGIGTYQFKTFELSDPKGALVGYTSDGTNQTIMTREDDYYSNVLGGDNIDGLTYDKQFYTKTSSGSTSASGTVASSAPVTATHGIQPRSIRVRYIMRIA